MKYYNFCAGPSALFPEVINQIESELHNWNNTHSAIFEISHRSAEFMTFAKQMEQDLRDLLKISDDYAVLFLSGGGRGGFDSVPLNIPQKHKKALYLISGHWSREAAKAAKKYLHVVTADTVDSNFNPLDKLDWTAETSDCDYIFLCSNETVDGVENFQPPKVAPRCLVVADMSSDICSREFNVNDYDIIFAGAQKNVGAPGVTIYIVRKSLLNQAQSYCPDVLNWSLYANSDSLFNTPASFSWYTLALTLAHIKTKYGNLAQLEQFNIKKANKFYNYLDNQDYYHSKVKAEHIRSRMTISFTTGNEELDALFVKESKAAGLNYLKGHKVVGGLRAAIYNAIPEEAVDTLVTFMQDFAKKHPK